MNRRIINLFKSKEEMLMKTKIKGISPNLYTENAEKITYLIDSHFKLTNKHESLQETVDIVFNAAIIAGINVILEELIHDFKRP